MKQLRFFGGRRSKSKRIRELREQDRTRQAARTNQPPLPLEKDFAEPEPMLESVPGAHTIMHLGQMALSTTVPPLTIGSSPHFIQ